MHDHGAGTPAGRVRDPGTKRVRDPEAKRRAILDAAAAAFAERGYRHATVREIAGRAGVTHGLVLRHFGSKEELFLAAVPGTRDIEGVAAGPAATLPERIASGFVSRMEAPRGDEPFLALVRSAGADPVAARRLHQAMQARSEQAYRTALGDETAQAVLPLLASLLIGVTFSRYVVQAGPLADMDADVFERHLAGAIRGLVRPPLATVLTPGEARRTTGRRPAGPRSRSV